MLLLLLRNAFKKRVTEQVFFNTLKCENGTLGVVGCNFSPYCVRLLGKRQDNFAADTMTTQKNHMTMKRNLFTLMMAILVAITTVAQTFTGRVVDEKQTPIPFANVTLLNVSDSAFVTGTTTNRDGDFTLTGNATKPIIKISYLGYKTQVLDSLSGHLGIIVLEPEATMLGEGGERRAPNLQTHH